LPQFVIHQVSGFRVGAARWLPEETLSALTAGFREAAEPPPAPLAGRQRPSRIELPGVGPVVVKQYRRGGVLAHFNKTRYLRCGKPRCQLEFEQTAAARRMGIDAPEPIAFAWRGRLFYRAWLVTRQIRAPRTLAQLGARSPEHIAAIMPALKIQFARLVDHGLWHVDLHPGNVLVDASDRLFLVDFDKARTFRGPRQKLNAAYRRRWQRAVEKYDLPAALLAAFD